VYNGNFDITRMLDQSNLSVQRCRFIFWVECSVGGYLALAKTYNKTRPILTDFKGCTKCCLAINHQLFQKVTAQIASKYLYYSINVFKLRKVVFEDRLVTFYGTFYFRWSVITSFSFGRYSKGFSFL
jgi:hypothetical protein